MIATRALAAVLIGSILASSFTPSVATAVETESGVPCSSYQEQAITPYLFSQSVISRQENTRSSFGRQLRLTGGALVTAFALYGKGTGTLHHQMHFFSGATMVVGLAAAVLLPILIFRRALERSFRIIFGSHQTPPDVAARAPSSVAAIPPPEAVPQTLPGPVQDYLHTYWLASRERLNEAVDADLKAHLHREPSVAAVSLISQRLQKIDPEGLILRHEVITNYLLGHQELKEVMKDHFAGDVTGLGTLLEAAREEYWEFLYELPEAVAAREAEAERQRRRQPLPLSRHYRSSKTAGDLLVAARSQDYLNERIPQEIKDLASLSFSSDSNLRAIGVVAEKLMTQGSETLRLQGIFRMFIHAHNLTTDWQGELGPHDQGQWEKFLYAGEMDRNASLSILRWFQESSLTGALLRLEYNMLFEDRAFLQALEELERGFFKLAQVFIPDVREQEIRIMFSSFGGATKIEPTFSPPRRKPPSHRGPDAIMLDGMAEILLTSSDLLHGLHDTVNGHKNVEIFYSRSPWLVWEEEPLFRIQQDRSDPAALWSEIEKFFQKEDSFLLMGTRYQIDIRRPSHSLIQVGVHPVQDESIRRLPSSATKLRQPPDRRGLGLTEPGSGPSFLEFDELSRGFQRLFSGHDHGFQNVTIDIQGYRKTDQGHQLESARSVMVEATIPLTMVVLRRFFDEHEATRSDAPFPSKGLHIAEIFDDPSTNRRYISLEIAGPAAPRLEDRAGSPSTIAWERWSGRVLSQEERTNAVRTRGPWETKGLAIAGVVALPVLVWLGLSAGTILGIYAGIGALWGLLHMIIGTYVVDAQGQIQVAYGWNVGKTATVKALGGAGWMTPFSGAGLLFLHGLLHSESSVQSIFTMAAILMPALAAAGIAFFAITFHRVSNQSWLSAPLLGHHPDPSLSKKYLIFVSA